MNLEVFERLILPARRHRLQRRLRDQAPPPRTPVRNSMRVQKALSLLTIISPGRQMQHWRVKL